VPMGIGVSSESGKKYFRGINERGNSHNRANGAFRKKGIKDHPGAKTKPADRGNGENRNQPLGCFF